MSQARATTKRGPYACSRCGEVGHTSRSPACKVPAPDPEPFPLLFRCLCTALLREPEVVPHIYAHFERLGRPRRVTDQDIAEWTILALAPAFDEGGDC